MVDDGPSVEREIGRLLADPPPLAQRTPRIAALLRLADAATSSVHATAATVNQPGGRFTIAPG